MGTFRFRVYALSGCRVVRDDLVQLGALIPLQILGAGDAGEFIGNTPLVD